MKPVIALFAAMTLSLAAFAQATDFKSNVPEGADPAALNIKFLPVDALALPNGDIQMGVVLELTVKNIGSKSYFPVKNMGMPVVLYQLQNGAYVPVKQINVAKLLAGESKSFNYYTTYIKGKQKPPAFRLVVDAKDKGVPFPDVNMLNNRKAATAQ